MIQERNSEVSIALSAASNQSLQPDATLQVARLNSIRSADKQRMARRRTS